MLLNYGHNAIKGDKINRQFKGDDFFNINNVNPFIKQIMEKPEYFKYEKNTIIKIVHMSPDNYFKECAKARNGTYHNEMRMVDFDGAFNYSRYMLDGDKFPVPYIDYKNGDQEGRHRAYAVQMLINEDLIKPTKIPVVVIKKANTTKEQYQEYIRKIHGDIQWE